MMSRKSAGGLGFWVVFFLFGTPGGSTKSNQKNWFRVIGMDIFFGSKQLKDGRQEGPG